jgi:Skp family chaperone for outer membrane proteins
MNPTGPVPITDIVQDAVRRDQALDRFEDFLRTKLKARSEEKEKENARLQAEIDELVRRNREAMDANRRALEDEEARLAKWQLTKKTEERRLFEAVSPFVESNPITTGEAASSSKPGPPAPAPAAEPETQA